MKAKKYLKNIRKKKHEVYAQIEYIKHLEELATKITTMIQKDKVQTTDENRQEKSIINLIAAKENVDIMVSEYINLINETVKYISMVEDNVYKAILIARYINALEWEDIAIEMNYSISSIYRLHNLAVKAFESIFNSK